MRPTSKELGFPVMPVEAFIGGCGHIVLLQEWPELTGDTYLRILIDPKEAEDICTQIMALANRVRR